MMTKIPVLLDEKHTLALSNLARQEYRDIRQQAAVIIRDELARRGLLTPETVKSVHPEKSRRDQANKLTNKDANERTT